jgi:hypothetical protein
MGDYSYGNLDEVKNKLGITTNNEDDMIEDCLTEAQNEIDSAIALITGSSPSLNQSGQSIPPQLHSYANKYAIARYYYYTQPDHPMEATKDALRAQNVFIKTFYSGQLEDGTAAQTFSKTNSSVGVNNGL